MAAPMLESRVVAPALAPCPSKCDACSARPGPVTQEPSFIPAANASRPMPPFPRCDQRRSEEGVPQDADDLGRAVRDQFVPSKIGGGDAIAESRIARGTRASRPRGLSRDRRSNRRPSPIDRADPRSSDECWSPAGSGFRGNGPSPPITHSEALGDPEPFEDPPGRAFGLVGQDGQLRRIASSSIVLAMPSYKRVDASRRSSYRPENARSASRTDAT